MLPSTLRANWLPGICRSKVSHLFFPSCTEIKRFIYHNNPTKRLKRSTQQLYDCFLFTHTHTHRHSCTSKTEQTPSFQTWFQLLLFHFSVHVVALWVMWYPLHPHPMYCCCFKTGNEDFIGWEEDEDPNCHKSMWNAVRQRPWVFSWICIKACLVAPLFTRGHHSGKLCMFQLADSKISVYY